MSLELILTQLHEASLHGESVDRLIDHYSDMRFYLGQEKFIEAGAHIGNFCENLANIVRGETEAGVDPHIDVGDFIDEILSGQYGTSSLEYEIRILLPRALRVAYDLRNNRDSVHVNLEVPVNHSDSQTAIRLCSWMLTELIRVYGKGEDVDEIADLIEELASPLTPIIDSYNGARIIMSRDLTLEEEILVHLFALGREIDAETLTGWIPESSSHAVKSRLGNLKQARKVHYENGIAKITQLGIKEAEVIIEEHFDSDMQNLKH